MPEFLTLPLSKAALAPPKANNISHSPKRAYCERSAHWIHLEFSQQPPGIYRGYIQGNRKPGATKNVSAASTRYLSPLPLVVEEKEPGPVAAWGTARLHGGINLVAPTQSTSDKRQQGGLGPSAHQLASSDCPRHYPLNSAQMAQVAQARYCLTLVLFLCNADHLAVKR